MDDIYQRVANRLRELRTSWAGVGISQGDLAKRLGVPQNKISRWETCTYRPSLEEVATMARFFGVPLSRFVSDEPLSPEMATLAEAVTGLTPGDLQEVCNFALFKRISSRK